MKLEKFLKKLKNKKNFYIENLDSMNSNIETNNLEKFENLIKSSFFFYVQGGMVQQVLGFTNQLN